MSKKQFIDLRPFGPGDVFDLKSYKGNLRALLFWCAATYLMWHSYDLLAWGRKVLGIAYEIDLAKQSWARLWAIIIGGAGIGNSIIMMLMIPINRWRARKSAKGQWYDCPDLKAADLMDEAPGKNSSKSSGDKPPISG